MPNKCKRKTFSVINSAKKKKYSSVGTELISFLIVINNLPLIFNLLTYGFCSHGTGSTVNTRIVSLSLATAKLGPPQALVHGNAAPNKNTK